MQNLSGPHKIPRKVSFYKETCGWGPPPPLLRKKILHMGCLRPGNSTRKPAQTVVLFTPWVPDNVTLYIVTPLRPVRHHFQTWAWQRVTASELTNAKCTPGLPSAHFQVPEYNVLTLYSGTGTVPNSSVGAWKRCEHISAQRVPNTAISVLQMTLHVNVWAIIRVGTPLSSSSSRTFSVTLY